jgi:hypothetical protein
MKQVIIRTPQVKLDQLDQFEAGSCPFCRATIYVSDFRTRGAFREFVDTGMCQDCQDEFVSYANTDRSDEEDELC